MKLAEALLLKSDLKKRIEQLRQRLVKNALIQEGDTPGEEPEILFVELDQLLTEYENLTNRIYEVNQSTATGFGTLADLVVQKEQTALKLKYYDEMAVQAGYGKKWFDHSKSSPAQLHAEVERLTQVVQDLDLSIQKLNWNVEL